ncbi:MAG: peptide chain release factor N(5)-glutamine methyltransferase [Planctomycetota bacterium]|nr:peptide chain release factor N(5)-glutamine methyltransferase [Planctomycetota bacterium]
MAHPSPSNATDGGASDTWTVRRLLDWIRKYLGEKEVDSPRVCAELLLAHVLDCERLRLYMTPDREASPDELARLRALVARAASHEPVQYLVGSWPFHGREFEVSPCTLIPRPATEMLVDAALDEMKGRGVDGAWNLLDLCTGSGCIAVSLLATLEAARTGPLSERVLTGRSEQESASIDPDPVAEVEFDLELTPRQVRTAASEAATGVEASGGIDEIKGPVRLVATDIDAEVTELARRNAARHGVESLIDFRVGSIWDPIVQDELGSFDIICANPPYVSDAEYLELDRNVRDFEPSRALRGGSDGLEFVRPIIREAPAWLRPGGLLLVELGAHTASDAMRLADSHGDFRLVELREDHEGFPRMLVARAK